jgi:hypothetical protein
MICFDMRVSRTIAPCCGIIGEARAIAIQKQMDRHGTIPSYN